MRDDADISDLADMAHALADIAAAQTLPRFRARELGVEDKGDGVFDPVTAADRAAERAMRAALAERRPRDGILGEEYADAAGESGLTWVIDPIDGTRAFMAGAPTWGTLVSVTDAAGVVFGLIDQPWTRERWWGGRGVPARLRTHAGESALTTRDQTMLARATLCSTFPEIGSTEERAAFARAAGVARIVRYGLDCYAYGLLAAGHVDIVIEAGLKPYDICAPIAVIEAAGGVVTDWDGGPAHGGGRILAAANEALHARARAALSGG